MSFAQLFQRSQFAAVAPYKRRLPKLPQSYVAKTAKQASEGDFGLKYDVPMQLRTGAVQVEDFDTPYGFDRVESRKLNVEWFSKLLTHFEPPPAQQVPKRQLSDLSKEEFQALLEDAKSEASRLRQKIIGSKDDKIKGDILASDLGYSIQQQDKFSIFDPVDVDIVMKPIDKAPEVKGRVLGMRHDGFAVGVEGIVCLLPNTQPYFLIKDGFRTDDRQLEFTFYVHEVRIDPKSGQVRMLLSMQQDHKDFVEKKKSDFLDDIDLDALLQSHDNGK